MVGIIGLACLVMATGFFLIDPATFNPDPLLQGLVWLGFAAWCFVTAWRQRS